MAISLTIPVISEKVSRDGKPAGYKVTPLFYGIGRHGEGGPTSYNEREDRALNQLSQELRKTLSATALEMNHSHLQRWGFSPEAELKNLKLEIPLRKQTIRGDFVSIVFPSMWRKIVVFPNIPNLSFDLERGESLQIRATEALTDFFKKMEKNRGGEPIDAADYTSGDFARLTHLEFDIRTRQRFQKGDANRFAMLGGTEEMSGTAELERVGRCLNRMFPNDLHRAILREKEVADLSQHYSNEKAIAKPLALVGPGLVGKSAVIHEFLYRALDREEKPSKREIWLLSPQRLISGMSYVGQWEERAHAIFKEAAKRKHILLFTDLTGLFQAGKSRDSDLTVGHLLKAYLEEEEVQIMAEVTPEAWRKLREIDRGFAEFFRVLHIREPGEDDSLRVMIRSLQSLEARNRIDFDPEVLPTIMQLQHRFVRTRAFPGKGVEMLQQLANQAKAHGPGTRVEIDDVYRFFQNKTGVSQEFLSCHSDTHPTLIQDHFESWIKGQPEATRAMTETVLTCAKQLNDPNRPMASLLFLGPTGVGKTECAKSLAAYFFGTEDRLLRFDMNEFVGGDAVGRLIGTWLRPQGLLTGGIRRQPYSVLLLDEIEKAHSSVFDLLLQLLGDGRLTDAQGQTADFGNCIVVMTSNLGARAARHQLGFGGGTKDESAVYTEAAEKFFRPELFNRLDRIVPFHELTRDHIQSLVEALSRKALNRQGITGRRLSLTVDPGVHEKLADLGFKPEYGARALRRAIEHHLVEPIALKLADFPQNEPASVHLGIDSGGDLVFHANQFEAATRRCHRLKKVPLSRADDLLEALTDFVIRIDSELERWFENDDGAFDPMDPRRVSYYNLREELDFVRRLREAFAGFVEVERKLPAGQRSRAARFGKISTHLDIPELDEIDLLQNFYAAPDGGKFLVELAERAEIIDKATHLAGELIYRANRISFLCRPEFQLPERVFLRLRDSSMRNNSAGKPEDHHLDHRTWEMYRSYLLSYLDWAAASPNREGYIMQRDSRTGRLNRYERGNKYLAEYIPYFDTAFIYGEGPALSKWLEFERGIQLFAGQSGAVDYTSFDIFPLQEGERIEDAYDRVMATPAEEGDTQVTRIHHENGYLFDLQTGRITNDANVPLWSLQMPLIEVAAEFRDFFES